MDAQAILYWNGFRRYEWDRGEGEHIRKLGILRQQLVGWSHHHIILGGEGARRSRQYVLQTDTVVHIEHNLMGTKSQSG